MDRLIEDYEKALVEEWQTRDRMETFQIALTCITDLAWFHAITYDEKLPQWKAKYIVTENLTRMPSYTEAHMKFIGAEFSHQEAKIRLAVALERLKLTRARLYGGRNEMLDMQEMAQASDQALD